MINTGCQHTLARSVTATGEGIHTGFMSRVEIHPAPADTGIVFEVSHNQKLMGSVQAHVSRVWHTSRNTTLAQGDAVVYTVEHLLAALSALNITNAWVKTSAPEIPILDGSSQTWIDMILAAGIVPQHAPQDMIKVKDLVRVGNSDAWCALVPCNHFRVEYHLHYDHVMIGHQSMDLEITPHNFQQQLAAARTFGFLKDVEALQAAGMSQGVSEKNVLVFTDQGLLASQHLRWKDEPVRHKMLDVVGDLSLAGAPIMGHFVGHRSGHHLNHKLVAALLDQPHLWCWHHPDLATWCPEFEYL